MKLQKYFCENDLAVLARHFREKAGKSKAEAARELGVAKPSITNAEGKPELSLTKLRIRIIETYSSYTVIGPKFSLKHK
jgi:DNA-binding XRE family transcriptional regulator